jgi:hypothetical protein
MIKYENKKKRVRSFKKHSEDRALNHNLNDGQKVLKNIISIVVFKRRDVHMHIDLTEYYCEQRIHYNIMKFIYPLSSHLIGLIL